MQENRLKHRLKQDVALNAEGLKVVQALMREKYISFTEALLFSEKVQDDYIYPVLAELSGIEFVRKEAVDLPENMRNILPEKTLRSQNQAFHDRHEPLRRFVFALLSYLG